MRLSALLQEWIPMTNNKDIEITGLSCDSRTTRPGDLFFATTAKHIPEAIANGAAAVISENYTDKKYSVPISHLANLLPQLGHIAAKFYGHPSQQLQVIGITGTNGKTSCTHFIAQALKLAGLKTAVIGTIGNGILDNIIPGTHTTPNPIELQQLLANFQTQHVDVVTIETSSHGLAQGRINGTQFYMGAFTNLTHDHLDYHGSMENYARAKFQLFEQPHVKYGILNADDPYGLQWLQQLQQQLPLYSFSLHSPLNLPSSIQQTIASHIQINPQGLMAKLNTPWGDGVLHTSLLGKFNISNLLLVITTLGIMGLPLGDILHYVAQLKSVPGRMQTLGGEDNKPLVIVDYAHTPDALAKTLQAIRDHCQGELWCVFGCGGDRDRSKRSEMGRIAEQLADQIIITDDNPRHENPLAIIEDIRQGILQKNKVLIEHNRRHAIQHAIACAKPKDVILIAGKGHETHQIIENEKIPFCDVLEVKMQLYT
jgi:UDP-N-acetylmuramoyl-L-alanyl-D-glutamate--2,6-diaminopimelate ligase